ncbi:hypothetical protein PM1_016 [Pectobacterium phage PM1]|uniref:Uncharacterized protein n=1 Tax=Pectobacterium phage PM1 TaxID=1399915 RepID=X2CRN2_9CAUD|nr:hypothetical protein PM1_016 [Pectobacterium phage PM1]AGV99232.1 hypothetical protein PM1_016 [Pectobacterium phage PM1]
MKKFGVINNENGYKFEGYSLEEILTDMVPSWDMNAVAVGADLYDYTGDLSIGPKMVKDLCEHIKELEAKLAAQNS